MKIIKEQITSLFRISFLCVLLGALSSCGNGDNKNKAYVDDSIEINGSKFKNGNIDFFMTQMNNIEQENSDLVFQQNSSDKLTIRSRAKSNASNWKIFRDDKLLDTKKEDKLDLALELGFYKIQLDDDNNKPYVLINIVEKEEIQEEVNEEIELAEEEKRPASNQVATIEKSTNIESNTITNTNNNNTVVSNFNTNTRPSNTQLDSDRDRIPDAEEIRNGTNKNNPCDPNPGAIANGDCDNDGLSNYNEEIKYNTNPLKKDTDGDGLSDYDEIKKLNTNPLVYNTAPSKGISNSKPTNPSTGQSNISKPISSAPVVKDLDNDGLSDSEEDKLGTDKRKKDTDGDKISDYDEVKKHKTNPKKPDSDFDGHSDFEEITKGSDPNNKLDPLDVEADFFPDRPLFVGIQRNGTCASSGASKQSSEIRVKITTDKKCVLSGCYIKLEEKAYLNVELQDDLGLKISSIKKQLVLKGEQQIPLRDIKETLKPGKNYFLTVKAENGADLKYLDAAKCKETYTNKGVTIKNTFDNKGLFDFKFLY